MATATIVPSALAQKKASSAIEPSSLIETRLYEVVKGQRVHPPAMAISSIRVRDTLGYGIANWVRSEKTGRVTVEALHWLNHASELQRRPDVSFVSFERWPRNKPVTDEEAWDVVPDLVVEVVSPNDKADGLLEKVEEYFLAGVVQVWIVYPRRRVIHVYESFTQIKVIAEAQELDGGTILPGFRVPLATLFEDLAAKEQNGA